MEPFGKGGPEQHVNDLPKPRVNRWQHGSAKARHLLLKQLLKVVLTSASTHTQPTPHFKIGNDRVKVACVGEVTAVHM